MAVSVQRIRQKKERGRYRKVSAVGLTAPTPPATPAYQPKPFWPTLEETPPDLIVKQHRLTFPHTQAATQFINFPTIPSHHSIPTPTFTGGVQTLQLFIAGALVPLLNPMGAGSGASAINVTSQTIGRSTCAFDVAVTDGSYAPVIGQTVLMTELGITIFAGCIDTIVCQRENGTLLMVTFHITALDKASICDRRVVTAATYLAGADVAATIQQIVDAYLNGEGITTQGVPTDGSLGVLSSDVPLNYAYVTAVFNQIAALSGSVWWIDQYGVLFFSVLADLPAAPFQLNEDTCQYQATVTTSLSGAGATSGYRNKQYVVTNLNLVPSNTAGGGGSQAGSSITESFTFTNGDPGIGSDYNPSGVLVPIFILTKLPIAVVLSITVNGVDQTFYEITQNAGQQFMGGTDYVWYYTSTNSIAGMGGQNQYATAQGVLAIPAGATIVITYVPGTNTSAAAAQVGTALDPTAPSGATFGTCGSGIFENVLQVQNISSQADLNAIAVAELAKSGGIPTIVDVSTNKPGLFVGMTIDCLFPKMGLPGTGSTPVSMLITKVTRTANPRPLNFDSFFTTQVEAVSNHDPGNWVTYFTRLIARSENPLPVLQQEVKTFVLAPSGSLAAGVVTTNPQYMDVTGKAVEVYGGFTNPPTDQDAVVTITDITTGQIIGSFTVPAGSTAQATTTIDPSANIYGFAKDTLTATVTYTNIGANPVAAANGTAKARFVH